MYQHTRYIFKKGDRVRHHDHPYVVGTIKRRVTYDTDSGERVYKMDPTNPWYIIDWDENDIDGGGFEGFEHQGSLVPEWISSFPVRVMVYLFKTDRELWKRLVDEVTKHG